MNFFSFFKREEKKCKPEPIAFYQSEQPKLPPDFASKLLQLQVQAEFKDSVDIKIVQELNQMYRTAIQFYQVTDPSKSAIYKRKIKQLLVKPHVIKCMVEERHKVNQQFCSKKKEVRATSSELKTKIYLSQHGSKTMAKEMIIRNEHELVKSVKIIQNQLETQQSRLARRMSQRRERSLSKSECGTPRDH